MLACLEDLGPELKGAGFIATQVLPPRAIAYARTGRVAEAERDLQRLKALRASRTVDDAAFTRLPEVAAEVLHAQGRDAEAFETLRRYSKDQNLAMAQKFSAGVGQLTAEMAKQMKNLPAGFGYQWTGVSYEQQQSGSQALYAYLAALVVVFLCLSALYESWAVPIAVLLVVPLGIIGAVLATYFRGLSNDIYFQVGLLVTIGLSAKNAILIIEFAKHSFDDGKSLMDAAAEAARLRLRPIMMTSLAFILGVFPLAIATGAGSGSENAIGTGVVGGMMTATILAIFLVPVFFVVVLSLFRVKPIATEETPIAPTAATAAEGAQP